MVLSTHDIKHAADLLGVEPCAVKAVIDVESAGSGFLPDGRTPKILFEGHIFWRELKKRGFDPALAASQHPEIVYPKPDRTKYRNGTGEHERLNAALGIHRDAALCSASWGLFQIMGFNYAACGFADVCSFADSMYRGEAEHLRAFCEFMRSEGLILFLSGLDFAGFARRYNGPGYAANQYDTKLQRAYERCRAGRLFG